MIYFTDMLYCNTYFPFGVPVQLVQHAQKLQLLQLLQRRPLWASPSFLGGGGGVWPGGGDTRDSGGDNSTGGGGSLREEKPFICPSCGKGYKWEQTLSRHLRFECGKEAMFGCPFCPQKCKQKGNLLAHIRNRHFPKSSVITQHSASALEIEKNC